MINNIEGLGKTLKNAMDKRISQEARMKRGVVSNGRIYCGARSYPYKQAVDCSTANGRKVWAQVANNGQAVVVGD